MNEENLKRYDNRAGFNLVCSQAVGLPVYKITIECLTQVQKDISPIEEYILKTIHINIVNEKEIANFLGLDDSTIREAMINLRLNENIDLSAPDSLQMQEWKLTKKGLKTLKEATIIVPEERNFDINFDALLWKVRWYGKSESSLLKSKDLKEYNLLEIKPKGKSDSIRYEIRLPDIDKIIKEIDQESKARFNKKRDLLAIRSIKKISQLYFQEANALVYKSQYDDQEIQVAFLIDGILSNEHEDAFASLDGVKKYKITESLSQEEPLKLAGQLLGDEFVSQIRINDFTQKKEEITLAETTVAETEEQIKQTENDLEKKQLNIALKKAQQQIQQLEQERDLIKNSSPIKWLEVYEHRPLLERVLKETQERLLIVSPWITSDSVNKKMLDDVEKLLNREVKIFIGYGLGDDEKSRERDRSNRIIIKLKTLADKYSHLFIFRRLGDTHAKILISDNKFAVTTSFNWLSFKGSPERTFRDERGTLVTDFQKINELFDQLKLKNFS